MALTRYFESSLLVDQDGRIYLQLERCGSVAGVDVDKHCRVWGDTIKESCLGIKRRCLVANPLQRRLPFVMVYELIGSKRPCPCHGCCLCHAFAIQVEFDP